MKFYNQINDSIKKISKGMIAIFTIKILLLGGIFIFQSCLNDFEEVNDGSEQKLAITKFKSIVIKTTPKIRSVIEKQHLLTAKGLSTNKANVKAEKEINSAIAPIISGTKELLRTFDLTESDLAEVFDDPNDPRISIVGLTILASENNEGNQIAMNFASILGTSVYAQSWGDIGRCAAAALGVDLIYGLTDAGASAAWKRKALKKLFKKVATRILGPVGVAIAIAEFGICVAGVK